jgi:hypothetical protein
MRRAGFLLLIVFAACLLGLPQSNDQVLGVWKSAERVSGEPRVVIDLRDAGGKLGGTILMRGVTDDDNNSTTLNLVIDGAVRSGNKMSFKAKMPDENVTEWEVEFDGDNAVASIVADNDGPSSDVQRWKMKRDR